MHRLQPHELSAIIDCRVMGCLQGNIDRDTLWATNGSQSGYRTSTIRRLLDLGLFCHPVAVGKRPDAGKPDRFAVHLTEAGHAEIAAQAPDHPMLHDPETNRAKWRVV